MAKFWMITNRNRTGNVLGDKRDSLAYYIGDTLMPAKVGSVTDMSQYWQKVSAGDFRKKLQDVADKYPEVPETEHEKQKHVTVFIHGYNNTWDDAAIRYQDIVTKMYDGKDSLGTCILFNWPSNGSKFGYLPDREDARETAPDLSTVFNTLYEQAALMQGKAANGKAVCKAKVSVIAHSMGNYVLQNALKYTWERQNKPLLMSLINQCLMVAADVDNDLFGSGEAVEHGEGEGIANLTYRIAALYSGRDSVLGLSSGLKHFGKRRLGRAGLDREVENPDNTCDFDCSSLFTPKESNIHSAYFWTPAVIALMRQLLRGHDRAIAASGAGIA